MLIKNKISSLINEGASRGNSIGLSILATYIDQKRYYDDLNRAAFSPAISERAKECLKRLRETGICVVEKYWSDEKCARARAEVDRVIDSYPEYVHPNAKADKRVYGANNASNLINEFKVDPLFTEVANSYNEEPTCAVFTLAARMSFSTGNLGSGEGWHRDSPLRQFKTIMYLSDVSIDNGPFQVIRNSHITKNILKDTWTGKLAYPQFRITDDQLERILANDSSRIDTYTAKAGTVIFADVSAIHRGMPIAAGTRYALTNYFFKTENIDVSLFEKFNVIPST
jgi:ectoine hydroxylase-related dioxygenase (phytanoyl-CoA dioxygenase family)